jgi:hypothetical protein
MVSDTNTRISYVVGIRYAKAQWKALTKEVATGMNGC